MEIENEFLLTPLNDTYKHYFDMFASIILKLHDSIENDQSLLMVK